MKHRTDRDLWKPGQTDNVARLQTDNLKFSVWEMDGEAFLERVPKP